VVSCRLPCCGLMSISILICLRWPLLFGTSIEIDCTTPHIALVHFSNTSMILSNLPFGPSEPCDLAIVSVPQRQMVTVRTNDTAITAICIMNVTLLSRENGEWFVRRSCLFNNRLTPERSWRRRMDPNTSKFAELVQLAKNSAFFRRGLCRGLVPASNALHERIQYRR
jgi:hypothetical protein